MDLNGHTATISQLERFRKLWIAALARSARDHPNQSGPFTGTLANGTGGLGVTLGGGSLTLSTAKQLPRRDYCLKRHAEHSPALWSRPTPPTSFLSIGANSSIPAVVNFSGTFLTNYEAQIGASANALGALYQTAGTLSLTAPGGGANFQIGNAAGAFGYYYLGAAGTAYCNEIGRSRRGKCAERSWWRQRQRPYGCLWQPFTTLVGWSWPALARPKLAF